VQVQAARFGVRELGQWRFRIASESDALAMTRLSAELPGLGIAGPGGSSDGASLRLRWIGGAPHTELSAGLVLQDAGRFFDNWGYDRVIEGQDGRAELALSWPGNPTALRMADTTGLLDFRLRDGRLLRGGSNNPLMRAIGVFNFDEVVRRLKLDFKDVYQSGLGFDSFAATIDFSEGMARTREPMELEGPSVRMRLSGQSDLRQRLIDADLIVTLPIGSNLPWVAVLAGGLPAAAGVYVASRLFEDQLGKMSSAVYKVSGELDDPQLEFVKVFDAESGGEKSPSPGAPRETHMPENPPAPGTPPAGEGAAGPAAKGHR